MQCYSLLWTRDSFTLGGGVFMSRQMFSESLSQQNGKLVKKSFREYSLNPPWTEKCICTFISVKPSLVYIPFSLVSANPMVLCALSVTLVVNSQVKHHSRWNCPSFSGLGPSFSGWSRISQTLDERSRKILLPFSLSLFASLTQYLHCEVASLTMAAPLMGRINEGGESDVFSTLWQTLQHSFCYNGHLQKENQEDC